MLCFFGPAFVFKIYSLKLYRLLNFTLHSKANAFYIGTCFRFYTQMRIQKKTKLLPIKLKTVYTTVYVMYILYLRHYSL